MNAVVGTSYTAEDEDILGANEDYTALEGALRQEVMALCSHLSTCRAGCSRIRRFA